MTNRKRNILLKTETGGREDFLRRVSEAAAAGGLLLSMLSAPSAAASLVVFEDGRHLRVASYEVVEDDRLTVGLVGGGSMTIPLDVVERIVDEEYERPAPVPESAAASLASDALRPAPRSVRAFSENLPSSPGLSPSSGASFSSSTISSPFSSQILEAAKQNRIDPGLIAAVIRAESNGYPRAVSRKGARGLMQLMPATARRLGVKSAFDPRENIRAGAAYLAELAERFGETNPDLILAAYNAGEHAVEEHGGVPPYRETRDYVRRVLAFWGSPALSRPAL